MVASQPRTLEDFEPLTPAEQKVLAELDTGELVEIGEDVPDADAGEDRLIRARFLRWVILGCDGSDKYRVHEKGVAIGGALITGEGEDRIAHAALNLQGAEVSQDLLLVACRFTVMPEMIGARMQSLILNRSHLPGVQADRLETRGNIALDSIESDGEVRLLGAQIGRDLSCVGATLRNAGGEALSADGARISGTVFLRDTEIDGEARFLGAQIDGDLSCAGATLRNAVGAALNADGARIDGAFFWRKGASSKGAIDLTAAEIGSIDDDPKCWPSKGELLLNRCRYGAFTGKGVSARERLDWLSRVWHPENDFRPQPYEQCAKVLREMGHQDDACEILIEKERRQREARRAKLSGPALLWRGFWDRFLAWTVCYGQKPLNAGYWLLGFLVFGTFVFGWAYEKEQFKPNNAFVLRAAEWAHCSPEHAPPHKYLGEAGQSQLACFKDRSEAKGLPEFNPFVYSLDVLFPLVQLEQQVHWIPDEDQALGAWGKALVYIQIVAGWLLSLLAVAGLSGIIKSD